MHFVFCLLFQQTNGPLNAGHSDLAENLHNQAGLALLDRP